LLQISEMQEFGATFAVFPRAQRTGLHLEMCGFGGGGREGKSQFLGWVKLDDAVPRTWIGAV